MPLEHRSALRAQRARRRWRLRADACASAASTRPAPRHRAASRTTGPYRRPRRSTRRSGPPVTVRFEGDPLPAGQAEGAGAGRARELGRRGPARGLGRAASAPTCTSRDTGRRMSPSGRAEERTSSTSSSTSGAACVYRVAPDGVQISGNQSVTIEELRAAGRAQAGDAVPRVAISTPRSGRDPRALPSAGLPLRRVKIASRETRSRQPNGRGPDQPVDRHRRRPAHGGRTVTVTGNAALSESELRPLMKLTARPAVLRAAISADRDALQLEYLNLGFSVRRRRRSRRRCPTDRTRGRPDLRGPRRRRRRSSTTS